MKWIALAALVLLLASGCRAPMPSFNPLAPLGTTRVPPPGTGAIGAGGSYYTPPRPSASPAIGTGFRPTPATNKWSNLDDPRTESLANKDGWSPTRNAPANTSVVKLADVDVALANHEAATRPIPAASVIERQGPIRILGATSHPSRPTLRGMPVNDVTTASEPRTFLPAGRVVDISELRDASPKASTSSGSITSSANGSGASAAIDGWQSRS